MSPVNATGTPLMPKLTAIPPGIATPCDYRQAAQARLDAKAWAYLDGGAGDELTVQRNRLAFDAVNFTPSMLTDVRGGHTRCNLFGQDFSHPIVLAPVAYQRLFHDEGELATVQAAGALEACMAVSTLATTRLETLAGHATGPLWFQLYIQPDRAFTSALVARAEQAGYQALIVTIDAPIGGLRNREQRASFDLPSGLGAVNLAGMPTPQAAPAGPSRVFDQAMLHAPTWQDIEALRKQTRLPLIIKGILSVADARRAEACGADGIIVSNHGGRVLDTVPPALDVLPAITAATGERLTLLFDSGIRRGSDVAKAIALGADAVLVGRPWLYGLAAAGALGVAHAIHLLREELEVTMALLGCRTLGELKTRQVCCVAATH